MVIFKLMAPTAKIVPLGKQKDRLNLAKIFGRPMRKMMVVVMVMGMVVMIAEIWTY